MMPTQFAILIPAYNEATTISGVIEASLQFTPHVIVVNDASQDDTSSVVKQTPALLLEHSVNKGKASALLTGFQKAIELDVDYVITLDGDGQHNPKNIPLLMNAFDKNPGQLIIAARLKNRDNAPKARLLANKIADFWVGWAASCPISDSQSGFRLYPTGLLKKLKPHSTNPSGFVFESEVLIDAAANGYQFIFVPIASCYPDIRRASHFRPGFDISQITIMVAKKLLKKGLNLPGLVKSLIQKPIIFKEAK
ncbi:glycosyltransferase family 2 protein [Hydrogenovibrio sp. 3SP14C1]|uniref:glycosyltransferase family 2 protein n=1 Tax=Hydrogenovibrio sp. 3SP14C1 TaxID=3038774 RepID=UPI002415C1B9|nr:glycosyltransferase family 2 protein [Hydrogenovibrio sp. 3SP14C1]MDG4811613.1 glycosyltransferase family 2 protein [Hydrogenovibrio sp. 3SP14C1]